MEALVYLKTARVRWYVGTGLSLSRAWGRKRRKQQEGGGMTIFSVVWKELKSVNASDPLLP